MDQKESVEGAVDPDTSIQPLRWCCMN